MEEFFKKTILLVEDEPGIRRSEKVLLDNAGYSVAEASNADEALNAVSGGKTDIDLVVMNAMFKTGDDGARNPPAKVPRNARLSIALNFAPSFGVIDWPASEYLSMRRAPVASRRLVTGNSSSE